MKFRFEKTCTNKEGYIVSIDSIEKIHGNIISSGDSMTVFDVSFNAVTMKPAIGDVLDGTVCMVEPYGVLVHIHEKLQVLVLSTNMKKYMFNEAEDGKEESYTTENKSITKGSVLKISLDKIKYEKKKYSCIGSLKRLVQ
jgi:DNA-directed RNA polymerase II subunit RPB7